MNIPYVMRQCTKCGRWLVANSVNFYESKRYKYRLSSRCRECEKKRKKQWYETNKDKQAKYYKQYNEINKDEVRERNKRYNEANKEKLAKYHKQWHQNNREKQIEYHKRYYQTPQGRISVFNKNQRRRIREEQQGDGITKDQWLEMMSFFNWRCAYSDEYIGGDSFNRTIDHIVPISTGGDNMIWNCVPMLRSLNSSKNSKDMEEWYKEQSFYSEARLQKIYDWQEYAYNKWGKNTLYFNSGNIQIKLI